MSTTDLLAKIPALSKGAHEPGDAMCILEAVSFVAGEPWSDHPKCACPVIGAFLRNWNDSLPDDERDTLLRPFIPRLINTKGNKKLERRRALMATDWLIRVHTPAWLRLAGLTANADALASLPEITDVARCPSLMPVLNAARTNAAAAGAAAGAAAWDAAWDAARDAAWAAAGAAAGDAAWDAAGAAAWAAARDAAWAAARDAAWAAAWDAARDAARAAAWDAARDAAWAALKATRQQLQQSAVELVNLMIET
jgi:hypothetical protein